VLCMKGGIYSDQRCSVCGSTFKDDGRKGLFCPNHPQIAATRFSVKMPGGIFRRFKNYEEANRFLTGLRYKIDEGTFDKRDYRKDKPLGFSNLIEKWLGYKKNEVAPKNHKNLINYANKAIEYFKDTNIKLIDYSELEDFITSQKDLSNKTKANILSALHNFWVWLRKRKVITLQQMPEFPRVNFELGYRKVISKDEQNQILSEVKRISYHINPKIYLGIKWLCTYIAIRPGELVQLKESHIDISNKYLFFPHPKEKRHKVVPITDEDTSLISEFPTALPSLPFFRHSRGSGQKEGTPFGQKMFYRWWRKACSNLGIEGVDLYGGTRHSTARDLRQYFSPEQIKRATMHSTNKAFERYFMIEADDMRDIYKTATPDTETDTRLIPRNEGVEKGKLLNFKN